MKMQNQNTNKNIPKVRYHPSIQTQTPADGARPKTRTSKTKKTRPAAVQPPETRTEGKVVQQDQDADKTSRVNPGPAVTRRPDGDQKQKQGGPKSVTKPIKKPFQRVAADPPQTPDQASDRATLSPQQVPLDLRVQLSRSVVEEVEVLTRGQNTNTDWFRWRENRITASVAHRIARCRFVNGKATTPPTSYLNDITGEGRRVQTRAMTWGINNEARAVREYEKLKTAALGKPVSVQSCGLFLDAQRPWLAASPDGIVKDSQTGERLLCLEVKCPYKHKDRRVEDACREDRTFCLELQNEDRRKPGEPPDYRLKTSHSYYTQIQCQLAVTGLRRADLVVFTLEETAIVPVTFDPDMWEDTVSKLEFFYRAAVLPHLSERNKKDTAAAWTPEL